MKTFKTQQEIWAHLANGGKVINDDGEIFFFKSDGNLNVGYYSIVCPEDWSIYEESKPKTVLHEYLIKLVGGFCVELHRDDLSFKRVNPNNPIIKTGRTIEVSL